MAVDNDPVAVEAARENVERNGVGDRVEVVLDDASVALERVAEGGTPPDLVLANITTEMIVAILSAVARALEVGGFFVAAGVSAGEGEERLAVAARAAGLETVDRRTEEGWTSFLFRKSRATAAASPVTGGRRLRAVFYTLGCKANLSDTASMMNDLRQAGWVVSFRGEIHPGDPGQAGGNTVADEAEPARSRGADLYVVNSCAVTARAEGKSRQLARKLKREHSGALVAMVGCYPAVHRQEAADAVGADLVLGTTDRHLLVEALRERGLVAPTVRGASTLDGIVPGAFSGERTRATLKVQDGCEQFCTYCVIPYARGPSRSRPAPEVLEEAARMAESGIREVVVTGIHLGAWGLDLAGSEADSGLGLAGLIRGVAAIPGLVRVRLSSIEPMEITDELLELMAADPKICRHLHVPLQSGSDEVLARMNRRYTAADYLAMVGRVRRAVPLVGLTTDVMVGFPGETDDEFQATLETVRRARFSRLHVFRFSRRPGTPAADMPGQVEEAVKKARSEGLIRLGRRLGREFRESLVRKPFEVLVERVSPGAGGRLEAEGLTDNYVRVTVPVENRTPNGKAPERGLVNETLPVILEGVTREGMTGRLP